MKKLLFLVCLLTATTAMAQTDENNPKDLWTNSIDVTLGDDWRQKVISVPGKGTPNVVDFFHAFVKAYPCEYYNLLTLALEGDQEVLFCHEKPNIKIDQDSCLMENESFSMRVFYENNIPIALGVCCHKAITTKFQDAYYYRYNPINRKLIPLAQGSDITGGNVKRRTDFYPGKNNNQATMIRRRGRCSLEYQLELRDGKLALIDRTKTNFTWPTDTKIDKEDITISILDAILWMHSMEPRMPEIEQDDNDFIEGGDYALPICLAYIDQHSDDNYAAAKSFEGFYYFYARGWERPDSTMLVAVYTRCAPEFDYYKYKNEAGEYIKTPHKLEADDEVSLQFYLCDNNRIVHYLDPKSDSFASLVGTGLPNLEHNEWHCVLSHENEDLVFVSEVDEQTKVFRWDGNLLKEQ